LLLAPISKFTLLLLPDCHARSNYLPVECRETRQVKAILAVKANLKS
jgi:hypothetical protein